MPQRLLKKLSHARSKSPIEIHQRLYELHSLDQKKREKNESIRQQNILKEEAKCTFHPQISKGSKKMTEKPPVSSRQHKKYGKQKRMKSPTVFDKLYEVSKKSPVREMTRQQMLDEQFYQECTFKPDIK